MKTPQSQRKRRKRGSTTFSSSRKHYAKQKHCVTNDSQELPGSSTYESISSPDNSDAPSSARTVEDNCDGLHLHLAESKYSGTDNGLQVHPLHVEASNPDNVLVFEDLKLACLTVTTPGFVLVNTMTNIVFSSFYDTDDPHIRMSVTVQPEFLAKIYVHHKELRSDHDFWVGLPRKFDSVSAIAKLLDRLQKYNVCVGNCDADFLAILPPGKTVMYANSIIVQAFREDGFEAVCNTGLYRSTIRATHCSLLVEGVRCQACQQVRCSLRAKKNRANVSTASHPKKQNRYLQTPEKAAKLKRLGKQSKGLSRKVLFLKDKLAKLQKECSDLIASKGESLVEADNTDVLKLVESSRNATCEAFAEDSFQRIFFEQQLQFNRLKNKKNMKWHPAIIKWCLYLKSKSAKAYSGFKAFISLPSERTLYDYSHCVESGIGFFPSVVNQLLGQVNITDEASTFVGLLQDEVKIKSDLVYDKHTSELIGYVNLNTAGNELANLEKALTGEQHEIASHLLVVMVRGITSNLRFPLGAFATKGITAEYLFTVIWEAITLLEVIADLHVLFVCCDGAAQNRKFFQMHKNSAPSQDGFVYRTANPLCEARYLYFISDPPHLLKTVRNCFSNSYSHKNNRKLWNDGDISWMSVVRLYEEHCEASEFRLCKKLARKHIDLTAFSKMNVALAAQVMSSTVANALELKYGDSVVAAVKFIRMINTWFDIVNTKNLSEAMRSRNPSAAAFTDETDSRLVWLTNDFIEYFDSWNATVLAREGNFKLSERKNMMLSSQTITGLKITSTAIAECVKFMLAKGAKFILTNRFNQDPLEQHFGHYRHKGGSSDNPTVFEACNTITNLRTVNCVGLAPKTGNTSVTEVSKFLDTPLPKRPRKK